MKEYLVEYCINSMHHSYVFEANSEYEAIQKALSEIPTPVQSLLHDFKVERYFKEWN